MLRTQSGISRTSRSERKGEKPDNRDVNVTIVTDKVMTKGSSTAADENRRVVRDNTSKPSRKLTSDCETRGGSHTSMRVGINLYS